MKKLLQSALVTLCFSLTALAHAESHTMPCWVDPSMGGVCCPLPADHSTDMVCDTASETE